MRLGIALSTLDSWHFFQDIHEDLQTHFETDVYQFHPNKYPIFNERINKGRFHRSFGKFLQSHDLVFFEWASGLLAAATQSHPNRCHIVTRLHSFELYDWGPKINWDAVDRIILVSQAMQARFLELYPEQRTKIKVIYNGISLKRFRPPMQRGFNFDLGMLCSIIPIKRIYEVVLAIDSVKKQGYQPHLHIAGEPAEDLRYPAAVRSLIERLNLSENVTFFNHVSDTPSWLQKIDILISNSFWEGQPVSLLEGMASGCYCLSHHWEGADEILPAENLYLTEAELIEKIIAYAARPAKEKEICRIRMRSIAEEKFDIEETKRRIRETIDEVS